MSIKEATYKLVFERAKKCVYHFYKLPQEHFDNYIDSRKEPHIKPRRMLACLCKTLHNDFSYESIGYHFHNQNHVTVRNLVLKCRHFIETEKAYKIDFNKILQLYINGIENADIDKQELKNKFFYVNLNECKVLKYGTNKAIVFTGISDEQIEKIKKITGEIPTKTLYDTGAAILKAKK